MFNPLPLLNFTLASGTLVLIVVTAVLLFDIFKNESRLLRRFDILVWPAIIGTSIGTVVLSLLYSEYFLFVPCSLCWLQRIAFYPQALMSIMAYKRNDTTHFPMYGIGLSVFGFLVAFYQYLEQMMPKSEVGSGLVPCLVDAANADCATKVIDEFGFVTFPFISMVTFAFLITLYIYQSRTQTTV